MQVLWEERAWDDYLFWQTKDKKTLKRINELIKDTRRNPFKGIGKPEPLKCNLSPSFVNIHTFGYNILNKDKVEI